ncbi:hypothetical protein ES332_D02G099200v1 [Gossypium tomentosum]|uniref:Uncharacterized protein n=1 Tax=Gossypium tomentosum TaxID=34277 RepID=A0A5D2LV97_GOSTO|nr:hypothetical protein ES332_D02G099200v1 [Gossypium tomentosum]
MVYGLSRVAFFSKRHNCFWKTIFFFPPPFSQNRFPPPQKSHLKSPKPFLPYPNSLYFPPNFPKSAALCISSKGCSRRRSRTSRSGGTDSWSPYGYPTPPQSAYPQQNYYYTPQHPSYAPSPSYNHVPQTPRCVHRTMERKYSRIDDNYQTLDQEL